MANPGHVDSGSGGLGEESASSGGSSGGAPSGGAPDCPPLVPSAPDSEAAAHQAIEALELAVRGLPVGSTVEILFPDGRRLTLEGGCAAGGGAGSATSPPTALPTVEEPVEESTCAEESGVGTAGEGAPAVDAAMHHPDASAFNALKASHSADVDCMIIDWTGAGALGALLSHLGDCMYNVRASPLNPYPLHP